MGCEFESKLRITGLPAPEGSRRTAALTREATWFAAAFLSTEVAKVTPTRPEPMELEELSSTMPLIEDTAFSITCTTCSSTTAGAAPGYETDTFTEGTLTAGRRSTPSPMAEMTPKAAIATKMPMASTYLVTEKRTTELIRP